MGSAALLALFGVRHTQSELHAINVLCSVFLPSLANSDPLVAVETLAVG